VAGEAEMCSGLPAKRHRFTSGLNSGYGVGVCVGVEVIEGGTGDETIGVSAYPVAHTLARRS